MKYIIEVTGVPLQEELRDKVADYYEKEGKGRVAKRIREKGVF
ncbi:MAG: hypothetical protein QW484_02560 [Candidatus Pacearchaeota archaeon]